MDTPPGGLWQQPRHCAPLLAPSSSTPIVVSLPASLRPDITGKAKASGVKASVRNQPPPRPPSPNSLQPASHIAHGTTLSSPLPPVSRPEEIQGRGQAAQPTRLPVTVPDGPVIDTSRLVSSRPPPPRERPARLLVLPPKLCPQRHPAASNPARLGPWGLVLRPRRPAIENQNKRHPHSSRETPFAVGNDPPRSPRHQLAPPPSGKGVGRLFRGAWRSGDLAKLKERDKKLGTADGQGVPWLKPSSPRFCYSTRPRRVSWLPRSGASQQDGKRKSHRLRALQCQASVIQPVCPEESLIGGRLGRQRETASK
ncbi:hypothetical protein G7Z17_g8292 [Cylindrodendrum hubeiense]|uniref:Uncharacterized protein n=1 Tax=Cylindrodendrum hubeiense TaxID=595255 RepID=A0A9P5H1H6_9HYPO|nr:hypothetical protein G7Z17_g8292 [Cylindrodendrum hubeiense]